MSFSEGIHTYWFYEHNGTPICDFGTYSLWQPSPSGAYVYTVNNLLEPTSPLLFDSLFTEVHRFESDEDDRYGWNAVMPQDSLYILCRGDHLTAFRVPGLDTVCEWPIDLPKRSLFDEVVASEMGIVCAVSNGVNIVVIDLPTGRSDTVECGEGASFALSRTGERLCTVHWTRDTAFSVSTYAFQGGLLELEGEIKVKPSEVSPGIRYGVIDMLSLSDSNLLIDYLAVKGHGERCEKRLRALIVTLPLTPTTEIVPFDSPIWENETDPESVYTLDWSGKAIPTIKRVRIGRDGEQ
jgi:hypothetical protein